MNRILQGDSLEVLKTLNDESVQTCVTSPPYFGLRDYGVKGQIGLEETPEQYVSKLVEIFREVRRVLRDDGTLWLNLGDSYAGSGPSGASYQSQTTKARAGKKRDGSFSMSKTLAARGLTYAEKKPIPPPGLKHKDLIGVPWRVAFALQADGWYLRQDIIWHKPNPMPESVTDRCTKAHEYIFLLSKSPKYYYDNEAVKEPSKDPEDDTRRMRQSWEKRQHKKTSISAFYSQSEAPRVSSGKRNRRSVWSVTTKPYKGAHFATFPPDLIRPCVLAGAPQGGVVLDPFFGSGTTGAVAVELGRQYIGVELNAEYITLAEKRLDSVQVKLAA